MDTWYDLIEYSIREGLMSGKANIPIWLRWVLFLPVAIIATLIVYPLIAFLTSLESYINPYGSSSLFGKYFVIIAGSFAQGFVFVLMASLVAPNHKSKIALILTIIVGLMLIALTLARMSIDIGSNFSNFQALLSYSSVLIGSIAACYYAFHKRSLKI